MNRSAEDILTHGLKILGISIAPPTRQSMLLYLAELEKWNRKMNLVARMPAAEMMELHFLDSLVLLPHLQKKEKPAPGTTLLDIGSGAGFPGLVLKCAMPELSVTLAEPRQKRVVFLQHIIRTLKLDGVTVCQQYLDPRQPAPGLADHFDFVTSRAVSSLADFLTLAAPFARSGGKVLCMKGPKAKDELDQWQQQSADNALFSLKERVRLLLPFSQAERNILVFQKN